VECQKCRFLCQVQIHRKNAKSSTKKSINKSEEKLSFRQSFWLLVNPFVTFSKDLNLA
jgi:hypothetical protein